MNADDSGTVCVVRVDKKIAINFHTSKHFINIKLIFLFHSRLGGCRMRQKANNVAKNTQNWKRLEDASAPIALIWFKIKLVAANSLVSICIIVVTTSFNLKNKYLLTKKFRISSNGGRAIIYLQTKNYCKIINGRSSFEREVHSKRKIIKLYDSNSLTEPKQNGSTKKNNFSIRYKCKWLLCLAGYLKSLWLPVCAVRCFYIRFN